MEERLQKIIARAGIASRRHAEEMITSGLVTVNGTTITELGSKADESRDHIKVAGKLLQPRKGLVYLLLHKPPEVVATMSDPEGRQSLLDLLHGVSERVFPVGRLEYHSAGLVFLTNDGDLANQMLRSHRIRQTYHLKLKTLLTFEEIETLGRATGAHIERIRGKESPWYIVTLSEARSDALRDKLFQTGHPVEKIRRVGIANLELGSLASGTYRELTSTELAAFKRAIATGENSADKDSAQSHKPHPKHSPHSAAPRTGSRNSWRDRQHKGQHASPSGTPRSAQGSTHGNSFRGPGGNDNRSSAPGLRHGQGNAPPRTHGKNSRGNNQRPPFDRTVHDKPPRKPFFRPGQQGTGHGPLSNMPQTPPRRNGPPNASYITPRVERPNITSAGQQGPHSSSARTGSSRPQFTPPGNRPRNAPPAGQHQRQGSSHRTGEHNSHGNPRGTDPRNPKRPSHRNAPRTGPHKPGGRKNSP
jgi:23S rRNA pseudouridine2605 synthase